MAEDNGAWNSEVFDNGRNFPSEPVQKTPATGIPAAMYNPSKSVGSNSDGACSGLISMGLRVAQIVFTIVGFAVLASDKGSVYTSDDYLDVGILSWNAIKNTSFAFLLSMDVIVCFYAIVQLVGSIFRLLTNKSILSSPTVGFSIITLAFDQVLACTLVSAVGAGAGIVVAYRNNTEGLGCEGFSVFCDKASASVAMSFFAFFSLLLSVAFSYYRLLKFAR